MLINDIKKSLCKNCYKVRKAYEDGRREAKRNFKTFLKSEYRKGYLKGVEDSEKNTVLLW